MKKILLAGLALLFTVAISGSARADGSACNGKKCSKGHHWHHKKGSKANSSGTTNGTVAPAK